MRRILVLDGVTGAGKSSVLRELQRQWPSHVDLIPEDETLGDLMDEIRDPAWRARPRFPALEAVLDRLERACARDPARAFVVERFHVTAYALFPRWDELDGFDARLAQLGAGLVLLSYPDALAEVRSIARADRSAWAAGMDGWYGSREAALEAVLTSQRLRWEALTKTRLPFLHLDTRERDWPTCARSIRAFWGAV